MLFSIADIPKKIIDYATDEGELLLDRKYYEYRIFREILEKDMDDVNTAFDTYSDFKTFGLPNARGSNNETEIYLYFIKNFKQMIEKIERGKNG